MWPIMKRESCISTEKAVCEEDLEGAQCVEDVQCMLGGLSVG